MIKELEQLPKLTDLHTAYYLKTYSKRQSKWQSIQYDFERFKGTICAFLNTDGGRIYCGLDPRKRQVLGVSNPEKYKRDLDSLIKEFFDKSIHPLIRISRKEIMKKTHIVVIDVDKLPEDYEYIAIDGYYYFRVDGMSSRTDAKNLDYVLKVVNYQFPYFRDISLSLTQLERQFFQKEGVRIQSIGDVNSRYLYKYMDLESALLSLEKMNLRFVEPSQWEDQYEGRFYNAEYYNDKKIPLNPELAPFLYACCFTTKRENEAAWVLYPHKRTGLASRCVEFRLDRRKLIKQIAKYVLYKPSWGKYSSLFFGKVQYESNSFIENVQNPLIKSGIENNDYKKYFNHFSLECYLNLLLLKRDTFEHEEEARIFIIPPDQTTKEKTKRMKNGKIVTSSKDGPLYVDIQWEDIIEEVRIDKHCSEYEKSILQRKLDDLFEDRLKVLRRNGGNFDEEKEKAKFTLNPFDPYEDKSLKQGPLSIITN